MLVVLVDPPLAAYAEQQVAEDEGEPVIFPGSAERELPVPQIVGYKADLDEDEGQIGGVQELEPEIERISSRVRPTANRPRVKTVLPA